MKLSAPPDRHWSLSPGAHGVGGPGRLEGFGAHALVW